jgi:hypothetical protein
VLICEREVTLCSIEQVSYTSWFLDAFNYAMHVHIQVLNLSIGTASHLLRSSFDIPLPLFLCHPWPHVCPLVCKRARTW